MACLIFKRVALLIVLVVCCSNALVQGFCPVTLGCSSTTKLKTKNTSSFVSLKKVQCSAHRKSGLAAGAAAGAAAEAAAGGDKGPEPLSAVEDTAVGAGRLRALYKFTRPHTIRGTILASVTGVARALIEDPQTIALSLVPRAALGMAALLMGNAYIVGINQIYDVDIDKVNKPFLPIAAGELGKRTAWAVVAGSAALGTFIVSRCFGPVILRLYAFGLLIGGLYSVPPFQFKRNPLLAGLTIACVRGFLLNFGVYYAVKEALGIPFRWNPTVIFLARFMTVFAMVIAITKDLPDIAGDKKYGVSTFATRLGVRKVAKYSSLVLGANYVSAVLNAAFAPAHHFRKPVMVVAHTLFAGYLFKSYQELDAESTASIKQFYGRIWDLFYAQYCIYPFI